MLIDTPRVIRSQRVLIDGTLQPAAVHVLHGRIERVTPWDDVLSGAPVVETGECILTPGLVDSHVHVNDPGRGEWEGYESATRAAAAGGITTIVDMPLNAIPATTTREAAEQKAECIEGRAWVDVALWGGIVPGNAAQLAELSAFGVAGFKCFLSPSGVEEFPAISLDQLQGEALPVLQPLDRPLLVHAEWPPILDEALLRVTHEGRDPRAYATWLATRPAAAETEAVARLRTIAARGQHVHVVHVSSAATSALQVSREGRAATRALTFETCPHYLTLSADEVPDGATEFKCAPPFRGAHERERLWEALRERRISMVASDHSPCPPGLKHRETGDFLAAWGGIASLELLLPLVWTGARARGFDVATVLGWCAGFPAQLAGLDGRKGRIAPGWDADLIAWDPDATFTVDPAALHHRHSLTPYAGRVLHGVVKETWVRGRRAYSRAHGHVPQPGGALLRVL
jgi:allantoinase